MKLAAGIAAAVAFAADVFAGTVFIDHGVPPLKTGARSQNRIHTTMARDHPTAGHSGAREET